MRHSYVAELRWVPSLADPFNSFDDMALTLALLNNTFKQDGELLWLLRWCRLSSR